QVEQGARRSRLESSHEDKEGTGRWKYQKTSRLENVKQLISMVFWVEENVSVTRERRLSAI
ncbi:MAG TPA: hypothetical protein VN658_09825, partial [Candidatus Acidoferrales bacterium]|nr:hypothetical protein [Candidatus Acidoferrales bacterium]